MMAHGPVCAEPCAVKAAEKALAEVTEPLGAIGIRTGSFHIEPYGTDDFIKSRY
jgi:hypothetical protein